VLHCELVRDELPGGGGSLLPWPDPLEGKEGEDQLSTQCEISTLECTSDSSSLPSSYCIAVSSLFS